MTTILGTYGNTRRLAAWEYMGILGSKGLIALTGFEAHLLR